MLSQGEAFSPREAVAGELARLISEVLTRLAERGVTDTPLAEEWAAIRQADPEEIDFCLAAARLGLDPYVEAGPYGQLIVKAAEELRGNPLGDFPDAVDPASMQDALERIRAARSDIAQGRPPEAAGDLRRAVRARSVVAGAMSWETGWNRARAVRRAAGAAEDEAFPLTRYVAGVDRRAADRGLQAVGGTVDDRGPVVVLDQGRPADLQRFTLSSVAGAAADPPGHAHAAKAART